MKSIAIFSCAVLALSTGYSEPLNPTERETLLQTLEDHDKAAESKADSKYAAALNVFSAAVNDEKATMELYLKCIEKIEFLDQGKKASEFSDWKRDHGDELSSSSMKLALRYQLRWLILTLRASSKQADPGKIGAEAVQTVDSIFNSIADLEFEGQILNKAATSAVFAEVYEVADIEDTDFPKSPMQLEQIYQQFVFPPLRTPATAEALRAAWMKRISQEGMKIKFLGLEKKHKDKDKAKGRDRDKSKDKAKDSDRELEAAEKKAEENNMREEFGQFLKNEAPELQWQMETDLFSNGDQRTASARMLKHIATYATHPSSREWTDQLTGLLKTPESPAFKPTSAE